MAAIRGTNSLFPCPTCLAPLEEMCNVSKDFEARTTRSMTELYRSVLKKTRAIRDKVLQGVGLRDVKV